MKENNCRIQLQRVVDPGSLFDEMVCTIDVMKGQEWKEIYFIPTKQQLPELKKFVKFINDKI
jgi:hypothetical protein